MNIKRSELLKALKQCLPGIENGNSVLEGADLFVFSDGFVRSYNDIISVSVSVKSEGLLEEGIEGAVRAEEFYGIINKFNGDLIEFTVADGKWILKSGKAKAELTLMSGDFLARFENIAPDKKKWLDIPPEFTRGLGICRMSNSKNAISGLYITSNDITSSDGFQINHYKYEGAEFANFWISDASAGELFKVGILTHIQLKGTWAHFKTADNTTFSVKTLQAEKWPYEKIMSVLDQHKKTKKSIAATFPKELFDAIDRASSFYLDISDSRAVRLSISPKRIFVSAERIAGKFEETVAWKDEVSDFPAFDLYVDTNMILFAARRSMSFYIHEVEDGAPRIIFTTENSIHLMATLLIDYTEKEETAPVKSVKAAPKKEIEKKSGKKKSNVPMIHEGDEEDGADEEKPSNKKDDLKGQEKKKGVDAEKAGKKKSSVKRETVDDEDSEDDKDEKPIKKKKAASFKDEDDEDVVDEETDDEEDSDDEDLDMGDEDEEDDEEEDIDL
jgi:hypothetical protein